MSFKQRAIFLPAVTLAATFIAAAASAGTLDRIKESGHIKLGYLNEARPFTFRTGGGTPEGYSIALCNQVVDEVKKQLGTSQLVVDWLAVPAEGRVKELQSGEIDLLCAPMSESIGRRQEVSFSIPVFPSGMRAVIRSDASPALRDALSVTPSNKVVWRGSPASKTLSSTTVAAVTGTPSEKWLGNRVQSLGLGAKVANVPDYRTGLQQLRDRKIDILFGERSLVLGAMDNSPKDEFIVLDRLFTAEPAALVLPRGDDDFRLLVDRSLTKFYSTQQFRELYTRWFGEYNDNTRAFFVWNALEQ